MIKRVKKAIEDELDYSFEKNGPITLPLYIFKNKKIQTIFGIYFFTLLGGLGGYLTRILFARNLSVSEYGLFYSVYALIFLFTPLRDMGLTESMIFYINKNKVEKRKKHIAGNIIISLLPQIILGTLIASILVLNKNFLATNFFNNSNATSIISVLSIIFVIDTFNPTFYSALRSFDRFVESTIFQNLKIILIPIIYVLSSNLKPEVCYLIASIILIFGIMLRLFYILYQKKPKIIITKDMIKDQIKYAIPILFSTGSMIFLTYTDSIMLTYLKGVEAVGVYNIALPIISIIITLTNPIYTTLFPKVSFLYHSKKNDKIKKIKSLVSKITVGTSIIVIAILFLFSKFIIMLLFGEKYIFGINTLRVSLLFAPFLIMRHINFSFIAGMGMPKKRSLILFYGSIINIVMNLIFIPLYSATGAAIATGTCYLLMWIISEIEINKKLKINLKEF